MLVLVVPFLPWSFAKKDKDFSGIFIPERDSKMSATKSNHAICFVACSAANRDTACILCFWIQFMHRQEAERVTETVVVAATVGMAFQIEGGNAWDQVLA